MAINKNIKIHGLMRSGTNFLQFMLQNNMTVDVVVNKGNWKHSVLDPKIISCDLYAIIYKDIFSWLYSIYKYAITSGRFANYINQSFSEFIRGEFHFVENGLDLKYPSMIGMYNDYYSKSLDNESTKKVFINYQDFLISYNFYMLKISKLLSINMAKRNIFPINNIDPSHRNIVKSSSFLYQKNNFYRSKEYMKNFNKEDIDFVNNNISNDVVKRLQEQNLLNLKN